jgi:hypothetical protein
MGQPSGSFDLSNIVPLSIPTNLGQINQNGVLANPSSGLNTGQAVINPSVLGVSRVPLGRQVGFGAGILGVSRVPLGGSQVGFSPGVLGTPNAGLSGTV